MCPVCFRRHKRGTGRLGALPVRCMSRWNQLTRIEQEALLAITGARVRITAKEEVVA